jgi:DDE superfamily endonuclease
LRAAEQERADIAAARAAWLADAETGVGGIAPERLVFLDECGVLTSMARLYGRSPRGTRAPGKVPRGPWTRLSVLGALGWKGMVAAMSVKAATSGAVFHAYLDRVLLPELRRSKPDAVLVMDNLGAHKTPEVRRLLDRSGFPYRYLPAYSPDLVWGFACQALMAAAPPIRLLSGVRPAGDDDRRGARSRARTSAPQPCIRSARDRAGP